jgi:hypothetical protein
MNKRNDMLNNCGAKGDKLSANKTQHQFRLDEYITRVACIFCPRSIDLLVAALRARALRENSSE